MNLRRHLTSPRRCSAAVVATAAALMLTPGTAFAAGHPSGPDRPASVDHTTESGDAAGHSTHRSEHKKHHATGHTAGHKNGRPASGHKSGHATAGHKSGHSVSHSTTGHSVSHSTGHTTGHPASSPKTGAHLANADPGTGMSSDSGDGSPSNSSTDDSAGSAGAGKNSGSKKSSPSGPMATVTKLSLSKAPTATRPVTMSARVSPAHRTVGAPPETGTVVFTVDGSSSEPLQVASNQVTVKIKLAAGEHTASAKYSGDSAHSPSESGPVSFTVS
ncbi:MAG: Ig-like domain repeat protein [Catenulisporales bacterium]|nr:Ig-like domain repeat protein [Catenulisporales bacterium]